MNQQAIIKAEYFMNNEQQFHLGFLPTEQSNSKTKNLDKVFEEKTELGVKLLLQVDRDVCSMSQKVFAGKEFTNMVEAGYNALLRGNKIVLSGCGATGRLSILLESIWRRYFKEIKDSEPELYTKFSLYEDSVSSIMTGGDYALIRSVESFEDYMEFGRQQVREAEMSHGDVLIAITEGGETSSVLGTVQEAVSRGSEVFLLFNNPADLLSRHLERSREAIENPKVTVLDLYCGSMAVAGSTRMQATTAEQLVVGAALETILGKLIGNTIQINYTEAFSELLNELEKPECVSEIAKLIEFERDMYIQNGLITYYADNYLLDIFTDTTERSPTFMLPPFRKKDDAESVSSWAFVKNPNLSTTETWYHLLGRTPRCLDWTPEDYKRMGADEKICTSPPLLSEKELYKFIIGNEEDPLRLETPINAAVSVRGASETFNNTFNISFTNTSAKYSKRLSLIIGKTDEKAEFVVPCKTYKSPLYLMEHLAVKLSLNIISTGTMVLMGRVTGNWMSWVDMSNKKLVDRCIRLISELCSLNYRDACIALHETLEMGQEKNISPVQQTIVRYLVDR